MSALDYILANYQQEKYQASLAERAVLRALVHTLNKEELLILQKKLKRGSSKWSVGKGLYEEAIKVMDKMQPHRNESISALLKSFTDKQSGKVTTTRKQLQDRFDKQEFQMQRKIIKAFLSSAKQDRMWAYNRLKSNWDNMFYKDVKTLWEQYHEEECGQVVLRHFPMEYVYNNLFHLETDENYTWLCIRLINHPKFTIDKEKLELDGVFKFYGRSDVELLYIKAKSNSIIKKGEATRIMFEQIIDYLNLNPTLSSLLEKKFDKVGSTMYEDYYPTTKWLDVVSHILWCMGELSLTEELVAYEEWDNMVQRKFISSSDYDELTAYPTKNFNEECYILFRNTIAKCIPDEYKHLIKFTYSSVDVVDNKPKMSVDELGTNHALSTFIEKLGLKVVE